MKESQAALHTTTYQQKQEEGTSFLYPSSAVDPMKRSDFLLD